MPRVKTLALTVAVLFALAGCAPMFEFNLFGTLDTPPTPTAADYQGAAGLDQLDQDLDSPAIVDALAADPTLVADLQNSLWTGYLADGVSGAEDSQAAIVYADLALKTTEGEQLVNNIVETILGGTLGAGTTVQEILADIVPPEALADPVTFGAMVQAFLAANDAYLLLGAYVDGTTVDGVAENDLPPGSLPGDVAQKAIVAYTMAMAVSVVMSDLGLSQADAITEMYKVANGQASPATSLTLGSLAAPPDPIAALLDLAGIAP